MKITSLIFLAKTIVIVFASSFCMTLYAENVNSEYSNHESNFYLLKSEIELCIASGIELMGFTTNGKNAQVNLKVRDISALSQFMRKMDDNKIFKNPKIRMYTEHRIPAFVYIEMEII